MNKNINALITMTSLLACMLSNSVLAQPNRDMTVKLKYLNNPTKFLQARDKESKRGSGTNIEYIEGDGFAFVESDCAGTDIVNKVCNINILFKFKNLVATNSSQPNAAFDKIAIHFFDDAAKSANDHYAIIKSAKAKGCPASVVPSEIGKWKVVMPISQNCHKLSVTLSGKKIANRITNRQNQDDKSSGRNIFYVIEARKTTSGNAQCQTLAAPFVTHFNRNQSCSTADPVLIVRRKGVGR